MASSQVPGTDHRNHLIILGGRALIFLHCLCDPVNSTRQKNRYSRICNLLSTGCIAGCMGLESLPIACRNPMSILL